MTLVRERLLEKCDQLRDVFAGHSRSGVHNPLDTFHYLETEEPAVRARLGCAPQMHEGAYRERASILLPPRLPSRRLLAVTCDRTVDDVALDASEEQRCEHEHDPMLS